MALQLQMLQRSLEQKKCLIPQTLFLKNFTVIHQFLDTLLLYQAQALLYGDDLVEEKLGAL